MVQKHFSKVNITAQETSKILHQAFPRATSGRLTVVFGVRRRPSTSDSDSGTPIISTPSSATFHVPTRQAHIEEELRTMQSQNAVLKERVAQLEMQNACLQGVARADTISLSILNSQIRKLTSPSTLLSHGSDTPEQLEKFTLNAVIAELRVLAPDLLSLFCTLGETRRNANEEQGLMTEDIKALCSLCILLNARSMRVKGLQLMISMMLTARGTSKQVHYYFNESYFALYHIFEYHLYCTHLKAITDLNHVGVCLSYQQTWNYLKSLVQQSNFTHQVQQGSWLWVYDNLNIHQRIHHERQG